MSEIAGAVPTPAGAAARQIPNRSAATAIAHESYAFACMRCGHGWEQSFEIEHHIDGDGAEFVMYVVGGERVPSPLTRPTCLNCGGHVVRIMRAGRVSSIRGVMEREGIMPGEQREGEDHPAKDHPAKDHPAKAPHDHHWHLSDLLHPFQHRKTD
ncbi:MULTISPECIES: hypothetical protein [unclassified Streptomyces]|uniref:hypothetical protein n=1 Tax=unclassified Streptomyces TaxID=2593676 RepID=UPI0036EE2906